MTTRNEILITEQFPTEKILPMKSTPIKRFQYNEEKWRRGKALRQNQRAEQARGVKRKTKIFKPVRV